MWNSLREAFKGVPQDEIDTHKKNPSGCWRCGRDNHNTLHRYTRTTIKGTALPEAPGSVVSAVNTNKRGQDEDNVKSQLQKQAKTVTAITSSNLTETPPAWEQDPEGEEDF